MNDIQTTQFSVRVGVAVSPFEGFSPSELLRGLRLLGVEFVEINNAVLPEIDRVVENIGAMTTAFHLPLVCEDGWDFSCADHQSEINETIHTLNAYRKKLRISHVISHPPEAALLADPSVSSTASLLQNLKRLHLPVYFENVPAVNENEFERTVADAQSVLGKQFAGLCFDAPHYYITGKDPIEKFRLANSRVGCIHLSDCTADQDNHIPFNCGGTLPVDEFLRQVADSSFSGFITLEIKPEAMNQLDAYINSYLTTLQYVNYSKYLKTRLRLFALRPLINRFTAFEFNKKVA
ncbi:MAG: sugar phosphate isomerase/epimerase [Calditrichaeota bacterium]|nr:MAG: sugar phosphate isomerase/epimerase [Calditrichota bacterium]